LSALVLVVALVVVLGACGTKSSVPPRTSSPGWIPLMSASLPLVVPCASATWSNVSPNRIT
jgi:hypothetical protein